MWNALKTSRFMLHLNHVQRCLGAERKFSYKCVELSSKKLIAVKGKDTFAFMQGMISNDIRHLYLNDETSVHLNCIFSFLLNFNGRIFADLMLYTFDNSLKQSKSKLLNDREGNEEDTIFVECDATLAEQLLNSLKIHKMRKKVDIAFENEYTVHCVYPIISGSEENVITEPLKERKEENSLLVRDPRLHHLGYRLLKRGPQQLDEISEMIKEPFISSTIDEYREHRYKLGVGEGAADHPSGSSFPLECNADFLHGVSFYKGCFVGQELTARVYHTGVIRKRIMPIQICDASKCDALKSNDTIVSHDKSVKIGKLRSTVGKYGLALLNVEEVKKCEFSVYCNDVELKVTVPNWWPKGLQKNRIPCGRLDHAHLLIDDLTCKYCN